MVCYEFHEKCCCTINIDHSAQPPPPTYVNAIYLCADGGAPSSNLGVSILNTCVKFSHMIFEIPRYGGALGAMTQPHRPQIGLPTLAQASGYRVRFP